MVSLYGMPSCVALYSLSFTGYAFIQRMTCLLHSNMLHLFSIDHALFLIREYEPARQCFVPCYDFVLPPVVSLLLSYYE